MIGMLQNGEADMIAADLTVTSKRMEVLDLTMPFMSVPLTVLLRKDIGHVNIKIL